MENAAYTSQSLGQSHLAPPYILVTSAFHMRRAMYIFKKAGVNVIPYPCNYLSGNTRSLDFIDSITPDAYSLWTWNFYIKENDWDSCCAFSEIEQTKPLQHSAQILYIC